MVSGEAMLLYVSAALVHHVGTFVPDFGEYVTGVQAFTKRLAVIAAEDSFVEVKEVNMLVQLFAAALLNKKQRSWFPEHGLFQSWLKFALDLRTRSKAHHYHVDRNLEPITLTNTVSQWSLAAFLLTKLKSFKGDIQLFLDIASQKNIKECKERKVSVNGQLHISHIIDQHVDPALVISFFFITLCV